MPSYERSIPRQGVRLEQRAKRFFHAIENLQASTQRLLLEVGGHGLLLGQLTRSLRGQPERQRRFASCYHELAGQRRRAAQQVTQVRLRRARQREAGFRSFGQGAE